LTEQRQERPLEGSIKWIKTREKRNKIQGIRRVPRQAAGYRNGEGGCEEEEREHGAMLMDRLDTENSCAF
jgi:hypothetical protein